MAITASFDIPAVLKILITLISVPQAYISCIRTSSRSLMANKSPIIISKHHLKFLLVLGSSEAPHHY